MAKPQEIAVYMLTIHPLTYKMDAWNCIFLTHKHCIGMVSLTRLHKLMNPIEGLYQSSMAQDAANAKANKQETACEK